MPPPKGIRFSPKLLFKRYAKAIESFAPWHEATITDEFIAETVPKLTSRFELPETSVRAVRDLFSVRFQQVLDLPVRRELSWRVATGFDLFVQEKSLRNNFELCPLVWVPLRVEDVQYGSLSRGQQQMYWITFRVLSGLFGGLTFKQPIAQNWVKFVLAREMGFPRKESFHPQELGKTLLLGLIDTTAERDGARQVKLAEVDALPSMRKFNKDLRAERNRPCLREFRFMCHKCPIGETGNNVQINDEGCPRAVHTRTFIKKDCPRCKTENYFDPGSPAPICIPCQASHSRLVARFE